MDVSRNVAIITCPRPSGVDYLSKTLVSLLTNADHREPIHIFNGSYETEYLDDYRSNPQLRIHDLKPGHDLISMSVTDKFNLNYYNALSYFAVEEKSIYLFEDDVLVTNDFFRKANILKSKLEKEYEEYVLALYNPITAEIPHGEEVALGKFQFNCFYGTQCLYMPAKTVMELTRIFYETENAKNGGAADMIIKEYANNIRDNLFFSIPSLVQHRGIVSTGLDAGGYHKSYNFIQ